MNLWWDSILKPSASQYDTFPIELYKPFCLRSIVECLVHLFDSENISLFYLPKYKLSHVITTVKKAGNRTKRHLVTKTIHIFRMKKKHMHEKSLLVHVDS